MIQFIIGTLSFLLCIQGFSDVPAGSWSPSMPISPAGVVNYNVFTSSDPLTGRILATWSDNNTGLPIYSIYTQNHGWSTPTPIDNINTSISDVFTVFNPVTKHFFAVWGNNTEVRYSTLVDTTWTPSQTVVINSLQVYPEITLSVSSITGQILAIQGAPDNFPYSAYYAFYDVANTWSTPQILATEVDYDVFSSFDPTTNRFLATWGDAGTMNAPATFSFYENGAWSPPQKISANSSVSGDVSNGIDPTTGQCLATWSDTSTGLLMYSFFDPNTQQWSAQQTINQAMIGAFAGIAVNSDHQWLATWTGVENTDIPVYSFNTAGEGWSVPSPIDPTLTSNNETIVFSTFIPFTGQFLATWSDNNPVMPTHLPIYSFFTPLFTPFVQLAMEGQQRKNNFGVASEYFNQLQWTVSQASEVVRYLLYRNGTLIATLPGSATSYQDHNQPKTNQLYLLVAENAKGQQTSTSTIVGPS